MSEKETQEALLALESMTLVPDASEALSGILKAVFDYEETIDGEWGNVRPAERIREDARRGSEDIPAIVALLKLVRA